MNLLDKLRKNKFLGISFIQIMFYIYIYTYISGVVGVTLYVLPVTEFVFYLMPSLGPSTGLYHTLKTLLYSFG